VSTHTDMEPIGAGAGLTNESTEQQIRDLDQQILHLLEARCSLTRTSLTQRPSAPAPFYPACLDSEQVLDTYRLRLGGPGELLARAVLNYCRAAGGR
jgi:hypothetical protein